MEENALLRTVEVRNPTERGAKTGIPALVLQGPEYDMGTPAQVPRYFGTSSTSVLCMPASNAHRGLQGLSFMSEKQRQEEM